MVKGSLLNFTKKRVAIMGVWSDVHDNGKELELDKRTFSSEKILVFPSDSLCPMVAMWYRNVNRNNKLRSHNGKYLELTKTFTTHWMKEMNQMTWLWHLAWWKNPRRVSKSNNSTWFPTVHKFLLPHEFKRGIYQVVPSKILQSVKRKLTGINRNWFLYRCLIPPMCRFFSLTLADAALKRTISVRW